MRVRRAHGAKRLDLMVLLAAVAAGAGAWSPARAAPLTAIGAGVDAANLQRVVLSDDGTTLVATSGVDPSLTTRRWRAGGWTTLTTVEYTVAQGVSKDGNVVAGLSREAGATVPRAVVHRNGAWETLPAIAGTSGRGAARGANADGSVIAGHVTGSDSQPAARWSSVGGGPYTRDSVLFADESIAADITDDGLTIVGIGIGPVSPARAYRWAFGSPAENLGRPNGQPFSFDDVITANAISGDGTFIVGTYQETLASPARAWRRSDGIGMNLLAPELTGPSLDVTNAGLVTSGAWVQLLDADVATELSVFLIANGVDVTGWSNLSAIGVSDDGLTFAGTGRREVSPGVVQPDLWIVTIPSPGGAAMWCGAGLLAMARRRRCVAV